MEQPKVNTKTQEHQKTTLHFRHIPFYNPRKMEGSLLEKLMVGRNALLEELLKDFRNQIHSPSRQHWLLRGPRGIGKTHLIGLLNYKIEQEQILRKSYLNLWLVESDVYEMYSTGILLETIATHLVDELISSRDPEAEKWKQRLEELEGDGSSDIFFESLREMLADFAEAREKILLIFIENLDALFHSFSKHKRSLEMKRLRSILLHEAHILFVSTTPTQYLKELKDPKQPLYGQLKERTIPFLTESELGELATRIGKLIEHPWLSDLATDEVEMAIKRRVLYRITAGNPRYVVMLLQVMSERKGLQTMIEDLYEFLDTQTAYFEARLARLASRESTILTRIALQSENVTIKEIARFTRLPERSLSTQVQRLVEEGYLMIVGGKGGKGTVYALQDGLFRIWYQYRKGYPVIESLVRFLSLWYSADELQNSTEHVRYLITSSDLSTLQTQWIPRVLSHIEKAYERATSEYGRQEYEELWKQCKLELEQERYEQFLLLWRSGRKALKQKDYKKAGHSAQKMLAIASDLAPHPAPLVALSYLLLARSFYAQKQIQHSYETLHKIPPLLPLMDQSGASLVRVISEGTYRLLGEYAYELALYPEALGHYSTLQTLQAKYRGLHPKQVSESLDHESQLFKAKSLLRLGQFQQAEKVLGAFQTFERQDASESILHEALFLLGLVKLILLDHQGTKEVCVYHINIFTETPKRAKDEFFILLAHLLFGGAALLHALFAYIGKAPKQRERQLEEAKNQIKTIWLLALNADDRIIQLFGWYLMSALSFYLPGLAKDVGSGEIQDFIKKEITTDDLELQIIELITKYAISYQLEKMETYRKEIHQRIQHLIAQVSESKHRLFELFTKTWLDMVSFEAAQKGLEVPQTKKINLRAIQRLREATHKLVNFPQELLYGLCYLCEGLLLTDEDQHRSIESMNKAFDLLSSLQSWNSMFLLILIRNSFTLFPIEVVSEWLEKLLIKEKSPEIRALLLLHQHVLRVAKSLKPSNDKEKVPGERYRAAISRVPPEMRATVEEIVKESEKSSQ